MRKAKVAAKRKKGKRTYRNPARVYRIFLGYQFKSPHYKTKSLESTIQNAVREAQRILHNSYPNISLHLELRGRLGRPLHREIIRMVRGSSITIFELSNKNMNVYFELGLATAHCTSTPFLFIIRKRNRAKFVGSDVRDLIRLPYSCGRMQYVKSNITSHIVSKIRAIITQERRADAWRGIREIWGGGIQRERITVVCGLLTPHYRPKYAYATSPEYVNLERFADKDALVEVLRLLPKLFPNTEIKYTTSEELHRQDRGGNLIVIGGPDFNRLTETLMRDQNLPYQYHSCGAESCFKGISNRIKFTIQKRRGMTIGDYGLFARFPNPLDEQNFVIMIGGLQTFGVLGAVKAFAMNSVGKRNTREILKHPLIDTSFAVLIPTIVLGAQPSLSNVDMSTLRLYPWK